MRQRPLLVDAHLDIAYNAQCGFDPRLPLEEARDTPLGRQMAARGETPVVTLPELQAGNVGLIFGTLFVLPPGTPSDLQDPTYATAADAHAMASRQVDFYRELEAEGLLRVISTVDDLRHVEASHAGAATAAPIGVMMLMEGADSIRAPDELELWIERGVRVVGPAWARTRYSGGTGFPGPLTPLGRGLMQELQRTRTPIDTSHMAEESFWDALRLFRGPAIASHANCRRFVPTDRHLSDDMIRAIVDRDGVIGVVLFNRFLIADWSPADGKAAVGLDAVVRQIEHICEVARDTLHAGIGSDLDGGFGYEAIPSEMKSCADLPLIGQALVEAGWRHDEAAQILGGNWLRWLRQALPAR